jgi:hypothetical protein
MTGLPRPDTNGEKGELCLKVRNRLTSDQKQPERDAEHRDTLRQLGMMGYYEKFGLGVCAVETLL